MVPYDPIFLIAFGLPPLDLAAGQKLHQAKSSG